MKRENGYYWVKIKKEFSPKNNDWQVAEWKDGLYFITGFELYYNDTDFEEIDERKIVRGEFYPVPTFATGGFIESKAIVKHQRGEKGKPNYPHAWKITDI